MFLDVKHAFPDIVRDCIVLRFRETHSTYQFVAIIKLRDDTELHVKDYLFADGSHKYAYHWQCSDGSLIACWVMRRTGPMSRLILTMYTVAMWNRLK